jgi:hypothetical protein
MNRKLSVLERYSDINEVNRRAHNLGLNVVHPSSQAKKKYMIFDSQKMIHFGEIGFSDATKHHDEKRIKSFRSRNRRWETAPRYSPAWLSWNLLW